ncbi:hypothetical protein BXZ70DRAFT_1010964 [Cristinia sonorae]|uniref:Uncharacterized protein n=1 Tax=Cristinia sonorae TaxID=1940300 RepID=A0A8K0UHA4_9AGAR|nr:hypothetical protein BXZ70DRAFT_1010964 [Cristinia sonorae]
MPSARAQTPLAPSNLFSTVALSRMTRNGAGELEDLTFSRGEPIQNPHLIVKDPSLFERPDVPHRLPPSRLPPAGNMHLTLRLGQMLGYGAVGRIFSAAFDHDRSDTSLTNMLFPPLVVKVSSPEMTGALLAEAQNYANMESLQGVTVPYCYGVYVAELPKGSEFLPWQLKVSDENDIDTTKGFSTNLVSILIMERTGGRVSVRRLLSFNRAESKAFYAELAALYADLADVGMWHCDVTHCNVVKAYKHSLFREKTSRHWRKPYQYRLVDFHSSARTNMKKDAIASQQWGAIIGSFSRYSFQMVPATTRRKREPAALKEHEAAVPSRALEASNLPESHH